MRNFAFRIKIFSDGADIRQMERAYREGLVRGFTTNPTLMRNAGINDYESFARKALALITDAPISFEVFSDDFKSMELEARKISGWGRNVFVKIPVTNTKGKSSCPLIKKLSQEELQLNITAILTVEQVRAVSRVLNPKVKSIVSVFAGRIADTGKDPVPIMKKASAILKSNRNAQLLWGSSREVLNIFQAQAAGCHIITVTPDILRKLRLIGKDLRALSLDTVRQFFSDAKSAGYRIL